MKYIQDQTALIAIDWGTSSLRAYRFGMQGQVLESRSLPWGIMQLQNNVITPQIGEVLKFEYAFEKICESWFEVENQIPVIVAGMAGSREGWQQVPYLTVPVALGQIGENLAKIQTRKGRAVHIVPGLLQNSTLPNVMRGEETQIIGAVSTLNLENKNFPVGKKNNAKNVLVGLPGTHSKWVQLQLAEERKNCTVLQFTSFMTGEMFAILCQHSILGKGMKEHIIGDGYTHAFERGLAVTKSNEADTGLLSTIFSTRTLNLIGSLDTADMREYLSGLLIGHEIAAMIKINGMSSKDFPFVVLVGDPQLCARYMCALEAYGISQVEIASQATERGFWELALVAGLLH